VTHDQVEAMTMADKIVVMQDGAIEQMGSPLDLYDKPMNRFVAQFIGSPAMNVFDGRIQGGRFINEFLSFALPDYTSQWEGQTVALGIRPEHMEFSESGEIEASVQVIEPTGSETTVFLKASEAAIAITQRGSVTLGPGDIVRFSPLPDRLHLFDAKTGTRLEPS